MADALVITPVKDSLKTTVETIKSINKASGNFIYTIFDDFSSNETQEYLKAHKEEFGYELVSLEDITSTPSPNYKLVLQLAQAKALELNIPLIIIESDVIIKNDTVEKLLEVLQNSANTGMVGAITVDESGMYNFPYNYVREKEAKVENTKHSLSFCCTLLSPTLLNKYNFTELSSTKDWFDIHISRQSKKLGFNNYLAKNIEVLHLPHSSRPWKQLKYSNPIKYYFYKYLKKRDRI